MFALKTLLSQSKWPLGRLNIEVIFKTWPSYLQLQQRRTQLEASQEQQEFAMPSGERQELSLYFVLKPLDSQTT